MALASVSAGDEILVSHITQFKNALEGASGSTVVYHLLQDASSPFIIELADAAGAEQFQITDNADAVIFSIDSNGEMSLREGLLFINGTTGGSAGQWWIGRNGADDVSINVPTGGTIDFLVNNTQIARLGGGASLTLGNTDPVVLARSAANQLQLASGDSFQLAGGNLQVEGDIDQNDGGTVTQLTSITTGVELNTHTGAITTVSSTLAPGAIAQFAVTNSTVGANDAVICHVMSSASAGTPEAFTAKVAAGSFDVVVRNANLSVALNNTITIRFMVFGGSNT